MATIPDALNLALQHHQAGRLPEAEALYRKILQIQPDHPDALHLLGVIAHQVGKHDMAVDYIGQAIGFNPKIAEFHNNIGEAFRALGKLEEAITHYRQALELKPTHAEGHNNLGNALREQGKLEEAAAHFRQALALKPAYAEAHSNLGVVLQEWGKLEEAIAQYRQALELKPAHAEVHYNLGNALREQGKLEEAVAHFRQALALKPAYAEARLNFGNILKEQGKHAEAEAQYQQALALKPAYAEAHNNWGTVLKEEGKLEDAITHYKQALALNPAYAEAYNNLGVVFLGQHKLEEAVANLRQALMCNTALFEAQTNLGKALSEQGRLEEAVAHYQQALSSSPSDGLRILLATVLPVIPQSKAHLLESRRNFEEQISRLSEQALSLDDPCREVGATNFYLAFQGFNDRELLVKIARLYECACPSLLYTAPHCLTAPPTKKSGKIKIGFLSQYFKNHSVGKAARGVLAHLSRERFSVTAIFVPPVADDEISRFVQQKADKTVVLPGSLKAVREVIAAEELDILFYQDIGMDPFTYFLAFSRLAPVQCVFFGHAETSGVRSIDYFISSENIEPNNAQDHYSERLITMKSPCAYYYKPEVPAALKPRSEFGLDDADHLYLCPQTFFKFHPDFDAILSGILETDARARLVLKEGAELYWTTLLLKRFERTMRHLMDRITVLPPQPGTDFINLIAVSDVMLDPLHFSGLTTSLEAFAVGTPVVTLPGEFQCSRLTLSLYNEMKMQDCVVDSPARYVELAVRLGTDAKYRAKLKTKILARNKHLYENTRVVKEYERAFIKMAKGQA